MIPSLSLGQCCDQCAQDMQKAQRLYRGKRYCSRCYFKLFKPRQCPQCDQTARLLITDLTSVCSACEKSMPCIRCGKTNYVVGKMTAYGPVCNGCAIYFRMPSTANHTARPDQELAVSTTGSNTSYATCRSCRRHRRIASQIDGFPLCKACSENGFIPCPCCGDEMPAGRGERCETCYWAATFFKRLAIDKAGISSSGMESIFHAFGDWLLQQVPAKKAAQSIHRYFLFFYEMDKRWGAVPSYDDLLRYFTAEGLRRVRLPMRWLSEAELVAVNAVSREQASENRRIEAIASLLQPGKATTAIFFAYKEALFSRKASGKTTLRTIRLLLQPAAALLDQCSSHGLLAPDQTSLERYLAAVPGQRNNMSGFVSFLNSTYALCLRIDHGGKQAAARRAKKLEMDIIHLLSEDHRDDQFIRQWLSLTLAYFHGLPRKAGVGLDQEKILFFGAEGFNITVNAKEYWVPHWDTRAISDNLSHYDKTRSIRKEILIR